MSQKCIQCGAFSVGLFSLTIKPLRAIQVVIINNNLLLLTSEWHSIVWMDHTYQEKDIWIISSLGQLCNSCYKHSYMDACVDLSFLFPRVYTQEWIAEWYSKSRFTFIKNGHTSLKWLWDSFQQYHSVTIAFPLVLATWQAGRDPDRLLTFLKGQEELWVEDWQDRYVCEAGWCGDRDSE